MERRAWSLTPLWPAGHLPLRGGDQTAQLLSPIAKFANSGQSPKLLISPIEGEMAGRPEGGIGERPVLPLDIRYEDRA